MSPRFPSLAPLVALSALLMGFSLGCGGSGPDNPVPAPRVDAQRSSVEVSRTQDVVADGEDSAAVTVTVRSEAGAGMAGQQVQLEVSGESATVTPASGVTDASGVVRAVLKATAPGVKTLTASVRAAEGVVVLGAKPGVGFVRRPPAAVRLAFTSTSLSATAGSPVGPVVEVAVQDEAGQTVPGSSHQVTLALGAHPEGAVLEGTLTVRAQNGVARFTEAVLKRAGSGYTLVASADGLAGATSAAFEVVPGPAARLAFTQQPARQSVRAALAPVRVGLEDAFGNTVAATPVVTVALRGGAATLSGTTAVAPVAGVASFADLTVDAEGTGYTLAASAEGLEGATSAAFDIVDDVPPAVAVLRQGVTTTRTLDLEWDAVGDDGVLGTATAYELRYATTPIVTDADFARATLAATGAPRAPGSREAVTLSGLTPATTYHVALRVTDGAGNASRSAAVEAATREPEVTQLAFQQQPGEGTAGEPFPEVRVALLDVEGNLVTSATAPVTLTLDQDLAITRTVNAAGGVATFTGLRLNRAGSGFRFTATSGALEVPSAAFTVRPGAARRLDLVGLAAPVVAGVQGSVEVIAYDDHGNVATGYAGTVHFTSTDGAAVLPADTVFTAADGGRRTFSVTLRTAGRQGVTVADGAMTDSLTVDVGSGPADSLVLSALPASVTAGESQTLTLTARDAHGNVATGYTGTVAFTLSDGGAVPPADASFSAADAGQKTVHVTFRTAADSASLTAADRARPELTATARTRVVAGPVARLVLGAPVTATAGGAFSVTVAAEDASGNRAVGYTGTVRFTASGANHDLPAQSAFTAADGGHKTFSGVVLRTAGRTTLTVTDAADSTLTAAAPVEVAAAAPAKLAFLAQPGNGRVRAALPEVRVTLLDAFDNLTSVSAPAVALTLEGNAAATLGGTRTRAPASGVASFTSLTVDAEGAGYTLSASADGLTGATSAAFSIVDDLAPARPVLAAGTVEPRSLTVHWDAVGDDGLLGTAAAYELRYATTPIATDADFERATLVATGTPQAPGTRESATLANLAPDTSYFVALRVTDGAGNAARSATLTLATGSSRVVGLVFIQQPVGGIAGEALASIRVALVDAEGNTVTSSTAAVTLTLVQDGSLTRTVNAAGGVATFSGLRINTVGSAYTFLASSGSLPSVTSAPFAIRPGAARRFELASTVDPVTAGTASPFEVTAFDAHGNLATGYTGTVRFTSTDSSAQLPADVTFTAADLGVATVPVTFRTAGFQSLTVRDQADATVAGTASVNVRSGAAFRLVFVDQPVDGRVRFALAEVRVAVLDAFGNPVRSATGQVSLALRGDPAATLGGTVTQPVSNGEARFPGLTVDMDGPRYTLAAFADGLQSATSTVFSILDDVAPARPLLAAVAVTRGSITVEWDAVGDDGVLGTAAAYELRYATTPIVTDADFAQATLAPTGAPRAPGSREAVTLTGLVPSTTYHVALRVTDNAGNAVRSATLTVSTQDTEATQLVFTQQPADGVAGEPLAAIQVTLRDENGHTARSSSAAVTLTLSSDRSISFTVNAVNGVATFPGVVIQDADPAHTLRATSGALPPVTSAAFSIRAAAAVRLALSGPGASVAGESLFFGLTAYDAFNNLATGYTGTVHVSSTDGAATLPADFTFSAADAGSAVLGVTLRTRGDQRVSVVDTANAALSAHFDVAVSAGPVAGFALTAPDTTTAGADARVTVTALDAFGNVTTGYTGTIHFSSTDSAATVPADFTFLPANQGRAQFDVVLRTAGSREVQVQDVSNPALVAVRTLEVTPGFAARLWLRAEAGPHQAGAPFPVEVLAQDDFGNVATGYDSVVTFTSSDARASLPGEYTFTAGDAGRHVFPGVVLRTAGHHMVTVTDFAGRVSQLELDVEPGPAGRLELVAATGTSVAGEPLGLALTVRDAHGNVATGYTGTVHFTSTDAAASLPADHTFTAADSGQRGFQATLLTAGTVQLTVADTVNAAMTATVSQTVEPAEPMRLTFISEPMDGFARMPLGLVGVALEDAYGNRTHAEAPAVQLTLSSPVPGATLQGTIIRTPEDGVATFGDLMVNQEGFSFSLIATATGLTSAMSRPFNLMDIFPPTEPALSAPEVGATRVRLSWIAVGDDGMEGDAQWYELRYSTQPILTESDWANAMPGPALTAQPVGSAMFATVTGLMPTTRYYFALEVMDGALNRVRAQLDVTTTEPQAPCDGVVCEPPAPTCSPDGRSVVTYASQCREVDGAGVCESTPAATTRCQEGTVCGNGACEPIQANQQAGNVIVSEFNVLEGERVELYNTTTSDIDLRGYTLEDRSGTVLSIRAVTDLDGSAGTPVVLPAGGYLHGVLNPADGVVPAGTGFVYGAPGAGNMLDDEGDLLLLSDADGAVEDLVDFRSFFTTNPNERLFIGSFMGFYGSTTQLDPASLDAVANNSALSWCVTFYPATGARQKVPDTLGAANGSCRVAIINEVFIDPNNSDDGRTFIEIAGPGGAQVGGMQLTDIEGTGTTAGQLNADGTRDTGETDGIFVIPSGTRIPADGLLIIADMTSSRTTEVANFVVGSDVLALDMDVENEGGDAIQLIAQDGTLLDAVGTDVQGNPLATNRAYNNLAMYESRTALYPPTHSSLARSVLSLDTEDNRGDFHGDPTPTPGRPNDTVNVTVNFLSTTHGLASATTPGIRVTGIDLPFGTQLRFGTNPTLGTCANAPNAELMVCSAPSNNGVAAVVDVTVVLPRSVRDTDITLPSVFTYTGVLNESNTADEADYCNLQWPPSLTVTSGGQSATIYTQFYEAGLTDTTVGGPAPGVIVQMGYGPASSSPTSDSSWVFFPAFFNVEAGNNDEYMAWIHAPFVGGTQEQFRYTSRFSRDNGLNWTYCDLNGAGSNGGLTFESTQLGVMTVTPP